MLRQHALEPGKQDKTTCCGTRLWQRAGRAEPTVLPRPAGRTHVILTFLCGSMRGNRVADCSTRAWQSHIPRALGPPGHASHAHVQPGCGLMTRRPGRCQTGCARTCGTCKESKGSSPAHKVEAEQCLPRVYCPHMIWSTPQTDRMQHLTHTYSGRCIQ
jgi:hypothetical protein